MLQIYPLVLIAVSLVISALAIRRRKHSPHVRLANEEGSLWSGLAAGLFDCDNSPAHARLEIALAALATKLKVRGAMITIHGAQNSWVAALSDGVGISGLRVAQEIQAGTLYSDLLTSPEQILAINYASLSEWRRHPAFLKNGWETYIGVNCGSMNGKAVVVSFFDTVPRVQPFHRMEELLVQQLAPWVAAMLSGYDEIIVPDSRESSILEKNSQGIDYSV